jgi:hypothetical protein
MAGYLPSQEILKLLVERIELLERVLAANTQRLHSIRAAFRDRPPTAP